MKWVDLSKRWMRCVSIFLVLVALACPELMAETNTGYFTLSDNVEVVNGNMWKTLDNVQKHAYILGMREGIIYSMKLVDVLANMRGENNDAAVRTLNFMKVNTYVDIFEKEEIEAYFDKSYVVVNSTMNDPKGNKVIEYIDTFYTDPENITIPVKDAYFLMVHDMSSKISKDEKEAFIQNLKKKYNG
jgi:hypothetical protein